MVRMALFTAISLFYLVGCSSSPSQYASDFLNPTDSNGITKIEYSTSSGQSFSSSSTTNIDKFLDVIKNIKVSKINHDDVTGGTWITLYDHNRMAYRITFHGGFVDINSIHYAYSMPNNIKDELDSVIKSIEITKDQ